MALKVSVPDVGTVMPMQFALYENVLQACKKIHTKLNVPGVFSEYGLLFRNGADVKLDKWLENKSSLGNYSLKSGVSVCFSFVRCCCCCFARLCSL